MLRKIAFVVSLRCNAREENLQMEQTEAGARLILLVSTSVARFGNW